MAVQHSTSLRNAILDAYETHIGASPTLEIRTGAQPANCAAADAGTVLATISLPANWMADAGGGSKVIAGSWVDSSADAAGVAGHYRIKQGSTCHEQGSITSTGGGGDMTLDNTNIAASQQVQITAFTKTIGGA